MDIIFGDSNLLGLITKHLSSKDVVFLCFSFKKARENILSDCVMKRVHQISDIGPLEFLDKFRQLDTEFWRRYFGFEKGKHYALLEYGLIDGSISFEILDELLEAGLITKHKKMSILFKNGTSEKICMCYFACHHKVEFLNVLRKHKIKAICDCGHHGDEDKNIRELLYDFYYDNSE